MRFNFDFAAPNQPDSSTSSPIPKEEMQKWVPLTSHPLFTPSSSSSSSSVAPPPTNLLAWDAASSRLYFWDSSNRCLHRLSIRLGDPDPTSVLAASPSKVLKGDVEIEFVVDKISVNRNGSALVLLGSDGLCVMHLYGRTSTTDNAVLCRTVSVGSHIYFNDSNAIRTLQVSWHPYSDAHLGILSSDAVFRLFDLSADLLQPEQEYYLQPVEPGRSRSAASICPVDFAFGEDHLWDKFSVFLLFSDGSIYILCPVVPFRSVYNWESLLELYSDADAFGRNSENHTAVSNSNLAISWLEATFPELTFEAMEAGNLSMVKAHPHALLDASLRLQGPLRKVQHGSEDEHVAVQGVEGRAVGFLYNVVSKDSILVTAWSNGQLQIDALADEIQPVWTSGSPPRIRINHCDHILGLAMICESSSDELPAVKFDEPHDHTVWLGHPPPLLRLAIVDLALPVRKESGSPVKMYTDPLMPERIYFVHDGGVDAIVLHFLPFTSQCSGKDVMLRTPSVHPVLSTCQVENSSPSSLTGFMVLSDSFGYSWIVGVTSSKECIVLEMKTFNLLLPVHLSMEKEPKKSEESKERNTPDIISKELLAGPKAVLVPQASPNLRSVAADSIEGRSTLHQYCNLFHENYVEYAHKVYFELKHHGLQLKRIIDEQHARLSEAQEKLLKAEEKQSGLQDRIDDANHSHNVLEERLQRLRNLPGAHRRPLSRAEREFKSDLDQFMGVELDVLHTSIDTVRARLNRFAKSLHGDTSNRQRQIRGKNNAQDAQISQLKSSLAKLSLINSENSTRVKIVESALENHESAQS